MPVDLHREGQTLNFRVTGGLTAAVAQDVRNRLKDSLAEGVQILQVDLSACDIVDSTGIGLLVATHNTLARTGGRLNVRGASTEIINLFKAMRLDRHFPVEGR